MSQLEVCLWIYFKAYLQTQCLFALHLGKIKRNQPRPQKYNYRPPQVWFILGSNFQLKVPRSSVQTIVCKYKDHGTTQPSYCSGRRRVRSPRDERTLVRKSANQSQNNSKGPCDDAGGNRYKSIYIHSKNESYIDIT